MADIFISYSSADREIVADLATFLEEQGYSVWWDAGLLAGQNYRNVIRAELEAARVAIVLWTTASVKSDWVISEAQRALVKGKLVPIRESTLPVDDIPQPFDIRHTIELNHRDELLRAVAAITPNVTAGNALEKPSGVARHPIALAPRIATAVLFAAMLLAFWLVPVALLHEFPPGLAFDLIALDSLHMLFFPIVGPLVLAGFFMPTAAILDIYWNYVGLGKARLIAGCIVMALLAFYVSNALNATYRRSMWELSPQTLLRPPRCTGDACTSNSMAGILNQFRMIVTARSNLSPFVVDCRPDPLLEVPPAQYAERYCFASGDKRNAEGCCRAQAALTVTVNSNWSESMGRSLTAELYARVSGPMLVLFVLVTIVVGLFLVLWRRRLTFIFPTYSHVIERHVVIGSGAMLLLLPMDFGARRSQVALLGGEVSGKLSLSLLLLPWFGLASIYFLGGSSRPARIQLTTLFLLLAFGVATYWDPLIVITEKAFGAGMTGPYTIVGLAMFVLVRIIALARSEATRKSI